MNHLGKLVNFLELMGYDEVRLPKGVRKLKNDKRKLLDNLKQEVLKCKKCDLHKTRHNVVFGDGDFNANLMLVGEAPGEQEDLTGNPFVGRAGHLLDRFLNIYGISRHDIYISNILKCRPPHNRNPEPKEIIACFPYLKKQIEIIEPKVILCLGAFSTRTLLNLPEKTAVSKVRGKPQNVNGITIIPTFHPAYLLRNRLGEPKFQRDLELALRLSGLLK